MTRKTSVVKKSKGKAEKKAGVIIPHPAVTKSAEKPEIKEESLSRSSLEAAYRRIRRREKELEQSRKKVENVNNELEAKLADMFFVHELFKAVAASTSVEEVTELVADGISGILGAEISTVYLLNMTSQKLSLRAWHGSEENQLRQYITLGEGSVGQAASKKTLVSDVKNRKATLGKKSFLKNKPEMFTKFAVPLQIKGNVLGVLAIAFPAHLNRKLTDKESKRLNNISNLCSLAVQNALFHDDLEKLSITDRVSNLYNRGYFDERLAEELDRAKRYDRVVSLIMIDIDRFKDFNDTFGHVKGDVLISKIAKIIQKNVRSSDIVARYGGDEFVIIVPETDAKGDLVEAERIRKTIEETEFTGNRKKTVVKKTISAGIASYPKDAKSQKRLIEKADKTMYDAKEAGRNRIKLA